MAGEWGWMAEVAVEELAKLEAAQPRRFGPLKAELKLLIAHPSFDAAAVAIAPLPSTTTTTSSSSSSQSDPLDLRIVSTQVLDVRRHEYMIEREVYSHESTSQKRMRWGCHGDGSGGEEEQVGKRRRTRSTAPAKDRAEMAIERAVRCLKRIRAFKASLLGFSD
uniref:Uncharacterized protein n=1 Tax=Leersia perrieri TaxID=77586 RepID=A0A0D9XKV8_9ORYZ